MKENNKITIVYFGCLAVILVLIFGAQKVWGDNEIVSDQVAQGDNLTLDITQQGYNNKVFFSLGDGDNVDIDIYQKGNNNELGYANDSPGWGSGVAWGGDIDFDDQELKLWQNCTTTTCNKNDIQFHISYGTDNKVWWAQGFEISSRTDTSWAVDTYEGGGHSVTLDIHGSNNEIVGQQRSCSNNNCSGHNARIYLYGDDNSVFGKQKADSSKTFNLTINNDDNTVDYLQDGNASHTANITLNGTYGTDLDLIQHAGSAQSYSLTQTCITVGGCTIAITQD
jgi:hypothetical protein